ncbi:MAG TPA: hypothetical protein VGG39_14955 [Polyangiaceae bacterium]
MPAEEASSTPAKTAVSTDKAAFPVGIAARPVVTAVFAVGVAALPVGTAVFAVGIAALPVVTAVFAVGVAALSVGTAVFAVGVAALSVGTAVFAVGVAALSGITAVFVVVIGASQVARATSALAHAASAGLPSARGRHLAAGSSMRAWELACDALLALSSNRRAGDSARARGRENPLVRS